ncbi:MAG: hypothetical protein ABWY58_04055 [Aeromicrobium sp.]
MGSTVTSAIPGERPTERDGWHTLGDAGWMDAAVEAVIEAHPDVRSSVAATTAEETDASSVRDSLVGTP